MTETGMGGLLRTFRDQVARSDPSCRIQDAARRHARRPVDDAQACADLQADLSDIPRVALMAEITGWFPRQDYLNDRAYRLLVGVRDGGTVPVIAADFRDDFAREEALGRLPLPEAFARIAATAPALVEMEQRARAGARPKVRDLRNLSKASGLDLRGPTLGVIWQHLGDCARGRVNPTPLYDRDVSLEAHQSGQVWPGT